MHINPLGILWPMLKLLSLLTAHCHTCHRDIICQLYRVLPMLGQQVAFVFATMHYKHKDLRCLFVPLVVLTYVNQLGTWWPMLELLWLLITRCHTCRSDIICQLYRVLSTLGQRKAFCQPSACFSWSIILLFYDFFCVLLPDSPILSKTQILVNLVNFSKPTVFYIPSSFDK